MQADELATLADEERTARSRFTHQVHVCLAASCLAARGDEVKKQIEEEVAKQGKDADCCVRGAGCMGLCAAGPLVQIDGHRPDATVLYRDVKPEDAHEVVGALGGPPVSRLLQSREAPFYARQQKVVLENSGVIDPERIEDYIANGGYDALLDCINEREPGDVVQELIKSGLRGRGGGGYPTGLKWQTVAKAPSDQKYVICNADEGDPGAFMDRSVLESDPHRVLEGMAIAGYAVGASRGYIYVRAEYPLAVKRLKDAIKQAEKLDLLGKEICGTEFSFHVEIRLGAGAFVCGEETALIASIEGKRGSPRPRPPYPAEYGLWGRPTLINNVETFASVSAIVRKGAAWYAGIGTEKSKGTKVFALAGAIVNTGLVEVPMGVTLRQIVFEIGGGIPDGRKFKAVQTGGPSGGCIPESCLDMPVDYESLKEVGSIMGSGGLIVMDETSCMVDVARFFLEFCKTESCGKCVPCRVGTAQMHDLLVRICEGRAVKHDLDLLEELCEVVRQTSLCGLGQTAPNPVLSTLRYFRDEYLAHIEEHRCPAGVCSFDEAIREPEPAHGLVMGVKP